MKPTSNNLFKTIALTAVLMTGVTACNRAEEEASPAEPVAATSTGNPLLVHVPADTPYAAGNMSPPPAGIVDAYLERFQPILDILQDQMTQFRADAENSEEEQDGAHVLLAILDEFDGKLNRDGLEELGFSLESHRVFYGVGAFPVMRVELADADALRAAVGRVEAKAGMTLPVLESNGTAYWRVAEGDTGPGLYIAILDNQLAITAFPVTAEADMLPAFLVKSLPADIMSTTNRIMKLNQERGYSGYGTGFLDLNRLADQFMDATSQTAKFLADTSGFDPSALDPVCVSEIRGMINKAPMMVAGTTGLTKDSVSMRYELDFEPGLAAKLLPLASEVPAAEELASRVFSTSLALKVGSLRDLLMEQTMAITNNPYQCQFLQEFNNSAREMSAQLNQPMPPFVGNLMGFRAALDNIKVENNFPVDVNGFVALHVFQPQMITGMAQMFVPGLDQLDLAPGSEPVRLPPEMIQNIPTVIHAAVSDSAIGLAAGEGFETGLRGYLDAAADNNGTFLSVSYDMARLMELQNQVDPGQYGVPGDDTGGADNAHAAAAKALHDSYMSILGRSRFDLRFTERGLLMENETTFR
jgi:hypothetical protein